MFPKTLKILTVSVATIFHSVSAIGQFINDRTNQIKISPLRIFDLVNPGVEFSYEKFYAKHYSSQLSVAWMKDLFNTTPYEKYKGLRLSFEEKYFPLQLKKEQAYYSAELVYLKVNYADISSYRRDTTLMSPQYMDTFNVVKQTLSFYLKYGMQIPIKRFVIDINAGIGIKHKNVRRNGVDDVNAYEVFPIHPNAYYMARKEGNYFEVSLPVNIKIGFCF